VLMSGAGCSHEEYLEQSLRRTGVMPYGIMHSDQAFRAEHGAPERGRRRLGLDDFAGIG
jgi:hypothetical protein